MESAQTYQLRYKAAVLRRETNQLLMRLLSGVAEDLSELLHSVAHSLENQAAVEARLIDEIRFEIMHKEQDPFSDERSSAQRSVVVTRGMVTSPLEMQSSLRMGFVPTAIYHLLDARKTPLVRTDVQIKSNQPRRVQVSCLIEGYSAASIDTVECRGNATVLQLPTLFPERIRDLVEPTRATIRVIVEDIESRANIGKTMPVFLLPRNAAPSISRDPTTDEILDLTEYLSVFVTPEDPDVTALARKVLLASNRDRGVPDVERMISEVIETTGITCIASLVDFNLYSSLRIQKVRLPRETLRSHLGTQLDIALVVISVLEAVGIQTALAIVPGTVLIAWSPFKDPIRWKYIDPFWLCSGALDDARHRGEIQAEFWEQRGNNRLPNAYKLIPILEARAQLDLWPVGS